MSVATLSKALSNYMPPQTSGKVVNVLPDNSIIVEIEGLGCHCRRAVSCLLMPEIGDLVLLSQTIDEKIWLLAVLEKGSPKNLSEITVQGDLNISTQGGSLTLNSEKELVMNSDTLKFNATHAEYAIDQMTYQGDEINVHIDTSRWVGERSESIWNTMTQFSQMSFRQVEKIEHLRVGQLDYQAQDYLRLHSNNALITAEKITKIDSEQIHVG